MLDLGFIKIKFGIWDFILIILLIYGLSAFFFYVRHTYGWKSLKNFLKWLIFIILAILLVVLIMG